jgi:nitronate monooxygenase
MLATVLTQRLGIVHPVIQAGMAGVARAELVAAVSNAGALGMLGMLRMPPDFIREQIRQTRALTDRPFGVNLVPPVAPPEGAEAQFDVCLKERVPILSLFWCDPAPFIERCHAASITVMVQVGSAEEAKRAVQCGADIVVAQGVEAGACRLSPLEESRTDGGWLPRWPSVRKVYGLGRDSSRARNPRRIRTTRNAWSGRAKPIPCTRTSSTWGGRLDPLIACSGMP